MSLFGKKKELNRCCKCGIRHFGSPGKCISCLTDELIEKEAKLKEIPKFRKDDVVIRKNGQTIVKITERDSGGEFRGNVIHNNRFSEITEGYWIIPEDWKLYEYGVGDEVIFRDQNDNNYEWSIHKITEKGKYCLALKHVESYRYVGRNEIILIKSARWTKEHEKSGILTPYIVKPGSFEDVMGIAGNLKFTTGKEIADYLVREYGFEIRAGLFARLGDLSLSFYDDEKCYWYFGSHLNEPIHQNKLGQEIFKLFDTSIKVDKFLAKRGIKKLDEKLKRFEDASKLISKGSRFFPSKQEELQHLYDLLDTAAERCACIAEYGLSGSQEFNTGKEIADYLVKEYGFEKSNNYCLQGAAKRGKLKFDYSSQACYWEFDFSQIYPDISATDEFELFDTPAKVDTFLAERGIKKVNKKDEKAKLDYALATGDWSNFKITIKCDEDAISAAVGDTAKTQSYKVGDKVVITEDAILTTGSKITVCEFVGVKSAIGKVGIIHLIGADHAEIKGLPEECIPTNSTNYDYLWYKFSQFKPYIEQADVPSGSGGSGIPKVDHWPEQKITPNKEVLPEFIYIKDNTILNISGFHSILLNNRHIIVIFDRQKTERTIVEFDTKEACQAEFERLGKLLCRE